MKAEIHPKYENVVFEDITAGKKTLIRSTKKSEETIVWEDGKTYPLIRLEVTSASHPFYTGEKIMIDTAGRVENYKKKFGTAVTSAPRKSRKKVPEKK